MASDRGHGADIRVAGVRVSSPDRVLYEEQGLTKRELVRYWEGVAEAALPHLEDRPLTLLRCPSGAHEGCFYQKHAGDQVPDLVPRVPVEERDGTELYLMVRGLPSLVALVQLGVLEFHPWNARSDRMDRPDQLVFDLDPGPGVGWDALREGALALREVLEGLGFEHVYLRTTGGKGLHLLVPLVRRSGWEEAKAFAKAVAERLAGPDPRRYTTLMSKSKREGRIFVDYLRNAANATAIATFSPRALPGAPVATPLGWDELEEAPQMPVWTVREVAARLAGGADPWAGFSEVKRSITKAMRHELGLG